MALQIFAQLEPTPAPNNRFRIIETYQSCDGMRTRVSHMSFPTQEAASQFIHGTLDGAAIKEDLSNED